MENKFDDFQAFYCGKNNEKVMMIMNKETFETLKRLLEYASKSAHENLERKLKEIESH